MTFSYYTLDFCAIAFFGHPVYEYVNSILLNFTFIVNKQKHAISQM